MASGECDLFIQRTLDGPRVSAAGLVEVCVVHVLAQRHPHRTVLTRLYTSSSSIGLVAFYTHNNKKITLHSCGVQKMQQILNELGNVPTVYVYMN